ncbi:MAG: hypothetical protein WDO69_23535 [Pseudomonadota bacterium]
MHVATEPRIVAQHHRVELAGVERVQQGDQPRALFEFGSTDRVVLIEMARRDRPAFTLDVADGFLNLNVK